MLRYFSGEWLNGIRNQTKAFTMVLLMVLSFRASINHTKKLSRHGMQHFISFG